MYAIDVDVIPWIQVLPDSVALATSSTELGEVKIYLYVLGDVVYQLDD